MDSPTEQDAGQPGKLRTWWHPLLASILRWQLGNHYQLQEEVPVGQKPLQIDLLLVRKQDGELPEYTRRVLAGLIEHFSDQTLVEFKSPTSTLRIGDFQIFLAYALLYRSQNEPQLAVASLSLVVIAPRLTSAYREEMRLLGVTPREEEPGIWSADVLGHGMWVLETDVLAIVEHPLLMAFSRRTLTEGSQVYTQLTASGYNSLADYMLQQIQQFRHLGVDFAMQHADTKLQMDAVLRNLVASLSPEEIVAWMSPERLLAEMSPEERVAGMSPEERVAGMSPEERVAGMSPEERVAGMSPEERVAGMSPEERVAGMSPEERVALRKLLDADGSTKSD